MYSYHWKHYDQLSKIELHKILTLRQEVFVVEQKCAYLDADQYDQHSFHLFARNENYKSPYVAGYLRVITPIAASNRYTIGRVLTRKRDRGKGLARGLMLQAMKKLVENPNCSEIKISAQLYLEQFYTSLGFIKESSPYNEDGIVHIEMIKDCS